MTVLVSDAAVDPVIGALMGAASAGGGLTKEQHSVIVTLAVGCWGKDEHRVDELSLSPAEVAEQIIDASDRRRLKELLVVLELCGHPLTEHRVAATETYAEALDQAGPSLVIARDLLQASAERTFHDYLRLYGLDPSATAVSMDQPPSTTSLGDVLESYRELPAETLGRAFFDFHERNGFALPDGISAIAETFVHHDTAHVITGYEPTGEGEIALGAMLLAAADTEKNWLAFIGNLLVHEVGHVVPGYENARTALLDHRLGRSMLVEALQRGTRCGRDLSNIDLLAMATRELEDVRGDFSVPAISTD
jgi:hypothetical protein